MGRRAVGILVVVGACVALAWWPGQSGVLGRWDARVLAAGAPPTVTNVTPATGTIAGGTEITLTGTGFATTIGVVVDNPTDVLPPYPLLPQVPFGPPAYFVVDSDTQMRIVMPGTGIGFTPVAGTAYALVVTNPEGDSSTTPVVGNSFTYFQPPVVSSISPSSGPVSGGTTVTIDGVAFTGVTQVKFGDTNAASFTVDSNNVIRAVSPARAAGNADITVTHPTNGTSQLVLAGRFVYFDPPTVTLVAPSTGPTAGGQTITITGTNLTGATAVTVGGVAATGVTVDNATTIRATTPAGTAGTASVLVTTPGGTNAANTLYTYVAAPTVASVLPTSGPTAGGGTITITGTNFTGATAVTIGGASAGPFTIVTSTSITATIPAGTAGTASVLVTTPGGTNPANTLYTYTASTPTISAVAPSFGAANTSMPVTLTGTNFGATAGAISVTYGSAAPYTQSTCSSPTWVSSTVLTCTVGSDVSAGTAMRFIATISGVASAVSTQAYTGVARPTVTLIDPTSGPSTGGTVVTVNGTNFVPGTSIVTFGGQTASANSTGSSTQLFVNAPAGTAGSSVPVVVTTSGVASTGSVAFTYSSTVLTPTVTGISPTTGPSTGGTVVTVNGTNFVPGTSIVTFGGQTALPATGNNTGSPGNGTESSTQLFVEAPAGTAGTSVPVVVTTSGVPSAGSTLFTYGAALPAPTITGVTPAFGAAGETVTVTLTGTNFGATESLVVTYGANGTGSTGSAIRVSNTQITLPLTVTGAVRFIATVGSQTSAASTQTYTGVARPTVTNIDPTSGPSSGGTVVTINGTNFVPGTSVVTFGGQTAQPTLGNVTGSPGNATGSSTQLFVTAPAGSAGASVPVVVTTNTIASLESRSFSYAASPLGPSISAISPMAGSSAGGTPVTITGRNLTGNNGYNVEFGSAPATILQNVANTASLVVNSPAGTVGAKAFIRLLQNGVEVARSSQQFEWCGTPSISNVSPTSLNDNTPVTLTGTNFCQQDTTMRVNLLYLTSSRTCDFTSDLLRSLNAVIGSSSLRVRITSESLQRACLATDAAADIAQDGVVYSMRFSLFGGGGASAPSPITASFTPLPIITGISPATGSLEGGVAVGISGSDLLGATAVRFGSTPALSFTVTSNSALTAVVPPGVAGAVDVTVVTPGGTSIPNASSRYVYMLAVPTMGEWFLFVLAVILAALGFWHLRRQRLERV